MKLLFVVFAKLKKKSALKVIERNTPSVNQPRRDKPMVRFFFFVVFNKLVQRRTFVVDCLDNIYG